MGVKTPTLLNARDSGLTFFAVKQFSHENSNSIHVSDVNKF